MTVLTVGHIRPALSLISPALGASSLIFWILTHHIYYRELLRTAQREFHVAAIGCTLAILALGFALVGRGHRTARFLAIALSVPSLLLWLFPFPVNVR